MNNLTRARVVQVWGAAVLFAAAISAVLGAIPSVGTATMLVALSLAPAAIVLLLWPSAQPQTAAEVMRGDR